MKWGVRYKIEQRIQTVRWRLAKVALDSARPQPDMAGRRPLQRKNGGKRPTSYVGGRFFFSILGTLF